MENPSTFSATVDGRRSTTAPSLPDPVHMERALAKFDYLGGDLHLDGAIADCVQALRSRPTLSTPLQTGKWKCLKATALYLRFDQNGLDEDAQKAQQILEGLTASYDPGSSVHILAMYGLGRVCDALFDRYAGLQVQEKACDWYRQALSAAQIGDFPARFIDEITVHLGRHLPHSSMDVTEGRIGASKTIDMLSHVVRRTKDTDPIKAYAYAHLSKAYRRRSLYGPDDSQEDLVMSEQVVRESLRIAPTHRHRSRFLSDLADICIHSSTKERIEEGINLAEEAMALLQCIPPLLRADDAVLGTLALGHANMYELDGSLAHLDDAIKYGWILASASPNVHPLVFGHLSRFLCMRFEATGHLVDIDDAIAVGHRAGDCRPTGYDADFIGHIVARAYVVRFAASGEDEDFRLARHHLETGIKQTVTMRLIPVLVLYLSRLYSIYFDSSGDPNDLDLSVEYGRKAINLPQTRDMNEAASALSEHGAHLLKRFEVMQSYQDLSDSINNHETALQLVSNMYHERHLLLWRYGRALRLRFERCVDPQDSERCEAVLQEALDIAVATHHGRQSSYSSELAALHCARSIAHTSDIDVDFALAYYGQAANTEEGIPSDRFAAIVAGARTAQAHDRRAQALALFSYAVGSLPRIAWLGLKMSMRHIKMVRLSSQLACDAAASAILAGESERAVELLDAGRSVIWRSVLELRTDVTDLEGVAPKLAQAMLQAGKALEQDDLGPTQPQISERLAEERASTRRRTAEHCQNLVQQARAIPGFETFLLPLPFSALREASRGGPVVVLNVSGYGSAALIVSLDDPIRTIHLPGLRYDTVRRLSYVLMQALRLPKDQLGCYVLDEVMLGICRQLWHGGIQAVAAALSDKVSPTKDAPVRVWWMPTGYFSLLPVHCAGPYEAGRLGIPDMFLSSYTTTLSALLKARNSVREETQQGPSAVRMLAIGLPETPGRPPLPSARDEMQILSDNSSLEQSCSFLYGLDATVGAVVNALPHYNWIHACCHGRYDRKRPLESAFNLIDGRLTLSRMVHMRLEHIDFAFLSACHTARHDTGVPDESMHMSAGMQVAGVRGVLGTAWSMADRDGPQLAKSFYSRLTANGRIADARNAAEALHFAIKDLRAAGVPLYRWAAFVHYGL